MTVADMLKLRTVTRTQGNNEALKDGTVRPHGFEFEFVEVDLAIRSVGGEGVADVIHASLMPWL